ncbi:MAG: hypothetical protein AAFV93_10240 [Chloroflexota bacterium]
MSVVLSSITLFLYAYLGTFMRLFSDDYCSAEASLQASPLQVTLNRYYTWNGRYTDSFLQQVLSRFKPDVHMWFPAITIILLLLSCYYFLSRLFKILSLHLNQRMVLVITLLVSFTFYRLLPSYQHVYWLSAIVPYTLSLILLIFWCGTVLHYFSGERSTLTLVLFLAWSGLVIFLLGGLTEALILTVGFGLLLMLLAVPQIPIVWRRHYTVIVIGTGVFVALTLALVILAPGSWERRNQSIALEGFTLTPLEALPSGILFSLAYLFGEFLGITFGQTYGIAFMGWLFVLGFLGALFYLEKFPNLQLPAPKNVSLWALIVIVIAFLLTFWSIYPVVYAARGNLPSRPLSIPRLIQFAMVLTLLYFAIVAAHRYGFLHKLRTAKTWSLVLYGVAFLIIWTPSVSIYKLAVLIPDFQDYARQWDERHQYFINQPDGSDAVYEGFDYYIEDEFLLLRAYDDPQYYVNRCTAGWYGLNSVTIEGGPEPPDI